MSSIFRRWTLWLFCAALTLLPAVSPHADTTNTEVYETMIDTTLILVGSSFDDAPYIVDNTSLAASYFRYCDGNRELTYRFDLSTLAEPAIYLQVWQNYRIEASSDGESFVTVADYLEENGGIRFDGSAANHTLVRIGSEHVNFASPVYVRLSNANAPSGYGGAVGAILLRGERPDESRPAVKVYGDTTGDGKADSADALQCLQHSVGLRTLTGAAARAADVDANNAINASDALLILQKSVGLVECFAAESVPAERILKGGNRLLFLGDSITDAGRDREDASSLGAGFVARIQCMLQSLYPSREFTFINRGCNGWTSAQVLAGMQEDCIAQNPDVVTLMVGINDVVSGQVNHAFISPEVYEYNLNCILDDIRSTGAVPIVISPYAVPTDYTSGWHEAELNDKIAAAQRAAEAAGAIYIPIDRILNEQWVDEDYDGGLSPDGVHPYESGINLLATEWLKAVEAAR